MARIDDLIASATHHGPAAETAVASLVELGIQGAPSIIEAMRRLGPAQNSLNLQRVIVAIQDPRLVPLLVGVVHDTSIDLVRTAFAALGQFRNPTSQAVLKEFVLSNQNRDARRSLAASALGRMGDARAIVSLLSVVDDASERKSHELALSAVIALAMLGNHERAGVAIHLAMHSKEQTIRPRAAEALQYVVAPGLFAALQKLLLDKYAEVRLHAVNGLFYLGTREAIAELLSRLIDRDATIANMVRARLGDLGGEPVSELIDPEDYRKWWRVNQEHFTNGVCYRLGRPIWLPDVIALLQEPNIRERTVAELKMVTGLEFTSDRIMPIREQNQVLENATAWWGQNGAGRFKAGGLYKYGYQQNMSVAFGPAE